MASNPIYQFYAQLSDYKPKIWRRFQVANNISVAKLGYIIMTMFEMQASHLFCIKIPCGENSMQQLRKNFSEEDAIRIFGKEYFAITQSYEVQNELTIEFDDDDAINAAKTKLCKVIYEEKDKLSFEYDYGDGWEIELVLEKIFEDKALPGKELPRVLEGDGYGIIEDCGGTGGLEDIAKAFKKKKGKKYTEYCEWLNVEELDLETFDINDINFRLKKVPRIYADCYEYGLEPTRQSIELLTRRYKQN